MVKNSAGATSPAETLMEAWLAHHRERVRPPLLPATTSPVRRPAAYDPDREVLACLGLRAPEPRQPEPERLAVVLRLPGLGVA